MARTQFNFTWACTSVTLLLELLYHSWSNLMSPNYCAGTSTLIALFNMFGVIGTAATAVWTDDLPIILQFKVLSSVDFFKRNSDLQVHARSCLLLPKNQTKGISTCQWKLLTSRIHLRKSRQKCHRMGHAIKAYLLRSSHHIDHTFVSSRYHLALRKQRQHHGTLT